MKLVWIISYSEEKELCKDSQHSYRKKIFTITMLGNNFKNILDHILLIANINMENIRPFSCNNFLKN